MVQPMVPPFEVLATKKGGFPVTVEKRPKGKVVTVINNVRGAAVALLRGLQTAAGTGGSAHGRFIELQGDHQRMVELFLVRAACIKGLTRDNFPAGTAPPPKKVSKHAPIDADAAVGASPHEPPPQYPRRHQKVAEWTPSEEDPRKYASSEWLQEEKRDCRKRAFATLMRSWPYWNHEYSRFPGLYSEWAAAKHGPTACDELHAEQEDTGRDPLGTPAMKGARTDSWEGPLREAGLLVERCVEQETRTERKVKQERFAGVERGQGSRLQWADEVRQPQVPSAWHSSTRTPSLGIASQTRPSAAAFRAKPAPLPPKRKTCVRPAGPAAMSSHTRKLGDGGGSPYVDTDDLHGLSDDDDDDDDDGRWEHTRHGLGRRAHSDSQSTLGRSDWLCAALSVAQGKAAAAGAAAGGAGGVDRGRGRGRGSGRDIGDAGIAPQERHFRGVDQWQGELDEEQALRVAMAASAQSDLDARAAAEAEAMEMEFAMAASRSQERSLPHLDCSALVPEPQAWPLFSRGVRVGPVPFPSRHDDAPSASTSAGTGAVAREDMSEDELLELALRLSLEEAARHPAVDNDWPPHDPHADCWDVTEDERQYDADVPGPSQAPTSWDVSNMNEDEILAMVLEQSRLEADAAGLAPDVVVLPAPPPPPQSRYSPTLLQHQTQQVQVSRDANADSWEHLQQWLEREVCALTDDADNTVLVEFVSAIDAHEEAGEYLMESLGLKAVELATEYVSRRMAVRPRSHTGTSQPSQSRTSLAGAAGAGRKKGRKGRGVALDPSYLGFHIPKGDVVD